MAGLSVQPRPGPGYNPYMIAPTAPPPPTSRDVAGRSWQYYPNQTGHGGGDWGRVKSVEEEQWDREFDAKERNRAAALSALSNLPGMSSMTGGGFGSFTPPAFPAMQTPQLPAEVNAPSVRAVAPANSEAFGRAKDAATHTFGKALEALKDQMSERGISGSGVEGRLSGEILSDAARYVSDAELQQQLEAQRQSWDAAKGAYAGQVQQRGQTISGMSDAARGAIDAYQAQLQAWQAAQQAAVQQQELAMKPWLAMLDVYSSIIPKLY